MTSEPHRGIYVETDNQSGKTTLTLSDAAGKEVIRVEADGDSHSVHVRQGLNARDALNLVGMMLRGYHREQAKLRERLCALTPPKLGDAHPVNSDAWSCQEVKM